MINSKLRFIDDNYSLQMPKLFEGMDKSIQDLSSLEYFSRIKMVIR